MFSSSNFFSLIFFNFFLAFHLTLSWNTGVKYMKLIWKSNAESHSKTKHWFLMENAEWEKPNANWRKMFQSILHECVCLVCPLDAFKCKWLFNQNHFIVFNSWFFCYFWLWLEILHAVKCRNIINFHKWYQTMYLLSTRESCNKRPVENVRKAVSNQST